MVEIWKDIRNFEGYQVSNFGRVRTHNKITHTNMHGNRHWKDRILKQKMSTNKRGRKDFRVDLWNNGKHKTILVARLVAFTFFNKDISDSKLTVNHIDGNSLNNHISNLEIISLKENIQHAFREGLMHSKKIKIIDKVTGTIIYPSSLCEGSKLLNYGHDYFSSKLSKNIFENERYKWELVKE